MGLGLVTDDRSREEGRHYTYESDVRLHDCGASDESKPLKHLTFFDVRLVWKGKSSNSTEVFFSAKELKKRAWGINPQALKR
jgi:hypothetical protein